METIHQINIDRVFNCIEASVNCAYYYEPGMGGRVKMISDTASTIAHSDCDSDQIKTAVKQAIAANLITYAEGELLNNG